MQGERVRTRLEQVAAVVAIKPRPPTDWVYNLEVQGEHVYEVGSNGILVHNKCIVYRVLRPDENPAVGLFAKNPQAREALWYHVAYGSRPGVKTQFISTTKSLAKAREWAKQSNARIVAIDLEKVIESGTKVYDLTKKSVANKYLKYKRIKDLAKGMQEVVVKESIPKEAIIGFVK